MMAPSSLRHSARYSGEQIGLYIRDMPGVKPMTMNQLRQVVVQIQPIIEMGIVTGYNPRGRRGA